MLPCGHMGHVFRIQALRVRVTTSFRRAALSANSLRGGWTRGSRKPCFVGTGLGSEFVGGAKAEHLSLHKWLLAFRRMASSKKGMPPVTTATWPRRSRTAHDQAIEERIAQFQPRFAVSWVLLRGHQRTRLRSATQTGQEDDGQNGVLADSQHPANCADVTRIGAGLLSEAGGARFIQYHTAALCSIFIDCMA
jgi:hypothetical protein